MPDHTPDHTPPGEPGAGHTDAVFDSLIAQMQDETSAESEPEVGGRRRPARQISLALLSAWRRDDPVGFDEMIESMHGQAADVVAVVLDLADLAATMTRNADIEADQLQQRLSHIRWMTARIDPMALAVARDLLDYHLYAGTRTYAAALMNQVLTVWLQPDGDDLINGYELMLGLTQMASVALDVFARDHESDPDQLLAQEVLRLAASD